MAGELQVQQRTPEGPTCSGVRRWVSGLYRQEMQKFSRLVFRTGQLPDVRSDLQTPHLQLSFHPPDSQFPDADQEHHWWAPRRIAGYVEGKARTEHLRRTEKRREKDRDRVRPTPRS